MDGDYLWIAARYHGLVRLNLNTGELVSFTDLLEDGQNLTHPYVRLLLKDSQGILWIGANKGLNRFDPVSATLRTYMPDQENALALPHQRIRGLFEDSRGGIWVGTSKGLLLLDRVGDPVEVWHPGSFASGSGQILAGEGVRGLGEDEQGRIWVATEGGITVFDRETEEVIILREENGLPSNATYCAIRAGQYMWVSTLGGLARINSETLEVESYSSSDGLPDNEFNFNAWHKLTDGRLAFGGLTGFTLFSPQSVPGPEQPKPAPPLQLQIRVYEETEKKEYLLSEESQIELSWQDNNISFNYSVLHFGPRDAVSYETCLSGVDNGWKGVGSQRMASYSGLPPGRYIFQVRAEDRHGQWQAQASPVSFTVHAPPWRTVQAYLLYLILALLAIFSSFHLYGRGLRRRAELLEGLVAERTAELNASSIRLAEKNSQLDQLMKTREQLFRAISHEIRTPISVIISVLESVQKYGVEALAKVPMARQSALRLDRLLGNILDLSRRDVHNHRNEGVFQIQTALNEILPPYQLQAETEGKELYFSGLSEELWLHLPRETFLMLVSNLLSNACKYTENGDAILVEARSDEGFFHLVVDDSGCGIPEGREEEIFDWFKRGESDVYSEGWGIGLAFAREAAEAAGGTVQLESSAKRTGARFVLSLPLGEAGRNEGVLEAGSNSLEHFAGQKMFADSRKPYTILLVEDDHDLLELLPGLFPAHWNCLSTGTAEQGWALALERLPDLVLTDLMLPGESGFDLTRKLKEDIRTAHIPVIILTALGNEERRLTGLGLSADSFMEKPFNNQELLFRVQGLIANRERVVEQVKRLIIGLPEEPERQSREPRTEDAFLEKLHAAFASAAELSTAGLDDVAERLAMSRRSVQREMQRLGISWREYKQLRKLRLAMDLLRNPGNRVATVAERAGYGSAAHFSKIFKQHTGMSPSEWRQNSDGKE